MMGDGGYGMGFGGPFMIFIWILIIVAIVALIAWLIGQTSRGREDRGGESDRALEILQQRYAKGEIDREEFEQKRQDLER